MTGTILLTGTSSGIGEAAARAFLDDGWNVVATARRPDAAVPGTNSPRLLRARLDVTDGASIAAAFDAAEERFGAVDTVVNNAGTGLGGPVEAMNLDDFRNQLEINVVGVAAVSQEAIKRMRPRRQGLLINVSSLVGRLGFPFIAPYSATKFAVEGLTEAMRYELEPFGIRVKLVEPGGVRTNFSHPWTDHPAYDPHSSSVHAMMDAGNDASATPDIAARAIVKAANDRSNRLRYPATDAGRLLLLKSVLPDASLRRMIGKAFAPKS